MTDEYIKKSDAEEYLSQPITMSMCLSVEECKTRRRQQEVDLFLLRSIPSADDVAPVRHGRWIQADEQPYFRKKYHLKACSECHRRCGNPHYEFCPWCGAKMDKEDTDGTTTD